jgi:hypothetical protein
LIGVGIKNKVHWNAIRILQTTPESWRESDGNFRKAFRRVPDPCAANEERDLLKVLFIARGDAVRSTERVRRWLSSGEVRKGPAVAA